MKLAQHIHVTAAPGAQTGLLRIAGLRFECALGRSGLVSDKREGDGGTPVGTYALREIRYRQDRLPAPQSALPLIPIAPDDGWCDAPGDPNYNRPVALPYPASAEQMWRQDHLYDIVVPLGYNDSPVVDGRGSAIFFHIAKALNGSFEATAGCVALPLAHMLDVLALCTPETTIRLG